MGFFTPKRLYRWRGHLFPKLYIREMLTFKRQPRDPKKVPIVINNRNRLTFLRQLIESLEERGYHNIYILDNQSTYPPLLEYYRDECRHEVICLDANYGYRALWVTDTYKRFWKDWYVYTDPDVVLDRDCPEDFMARFLELYKRYKKSYKIGFGLRTDDLPDHYDRKQEVCRFEARYWEKPLEPGAYRALIDTTFALYRPYSFGEARGGRWSWNVRTGPPYVVHHMPWYVDTANPPAEELYYTEHADSSNSWSLK